MTAAGSSLGGLRLLRVLVTTHAEFIRGFDMCGACFVAVVAFDDLGDQTGPPGLVTGTAAAPGITVEVLVEDVDVLVNFRGTLRARKSTPKPYVWCPQADLQW